MKRITPLLLTAMLTACGPSETPKQPNVPTVEELAADAARLKELRQQCKTDRAALGDVFPGHKLEGGGGRSVSWRPEFLLAAVRTPERGGCRLQGDSHATPKLPSQMP